MPNSYKHPSLIFIVLLIAIFFINNAYSQRENINQKSYVDIDKAILNIELYKMYSHYLNIYHRKIINIEAKYNRLLKKWRVKAKNTIGKLDDNVRAIWELQSIIFEIKEKLKIANQKYNELKSEMRFECTVKVIMFFKSTFKKKKEYRRTLLIDLKYKASFNENDSMTDYTKIFVKMFNTWEFDESDSQF